MKFHEISQNSGNSSFLRKFTEIRVLGVRSSAEPFLDSGGSGVGDWAGHPVGKWRLRWLHCRIILAGEGGGGGV